MKLFRVTMAASASVSSAVLVEATDEDDAKLKAMQLAKEGGVNWQYDGANDDDVEVVQIQETP